MPKTIKDIVCVKSEAALIKGVQLNWYEDSQQERENRRLATGYIFSSGRGAPEKRLFPAISIFEKIRESLNQPTSYNVFTVIAKYGHGKSHFALVLANYFGRQPGDEVLEGVLRQVEVCSNANTAYHFRSFKENAQKPQLVICLSGADFTDLRQGFMEAARRSLQKHEQTRNYAIKSVSLRAVDWLKSLGTEQKTRAQSYLVERYGLELDALIQSLSQFDLSMEGVARELSKVVLGVPADFGADLNLREAITQLVDDLCTGEDAPFSKMVILFDELGIYAEKWCYNKMAAGGLAPQQIIEACDSRRGRVCLVGFLQREMGEFVKLYSMPEELQEEFRKWADRFPTQTCFSLEASLERVIEGLLTKSTDGKQLIKDFRPQIERACDAAWRILPYYQQRPDAWNEGDFRSTVGLGTLPFHPITTGLLCNLEFVQGERTIIGFVDESIRNVSDQPAVKEGTLNWILPTSLVDEFRNNFEGHSDRYALYAHAQQRLGHNVDPDLYLVLKALFLFDVGKLRRSPSQAHERVLAHLCGLSEDRARELLKQLEEDYFVIHYSQARKEYEFAGIGTSPIEIRQQLQGEIVGKKITSLAQSLGALNILQQVGLPESEASGFKAEHAIEGDEWRLLPSLLDARKLEVGTVRRLLLELDEKGAERGLLICIVSSDSVELDNAKTAGHRVLDEIRCSEHPCPIVIAVPKSPAVGLDREILLRNALDSWGEDRRKLYSEGFDLAMKDANRRLEDALRAHLKDQDYVVPTIVEQRLNVGESTRLDRIADRLFESCFPSRVPGRSNIMKVTSSSGNAAVAEIARHLLLNEMDYGKLDQKARNLVTAVLTEGPDKWGILNLKYRLRTPASPHVLKAWEELDRRVSGSIPVPFKSLSSVLRSIPYGHDDFTLTLLYAAWIGTNKNDLGFTGRVDMKEDRPPTLVLQEIQSQIKKAKDFIRWLDVGDVRVHRPSLRNRQKALDFLEGIKQSSTLEGARSLILQVNGILGGLSSEEQLAKDVTQAVNTLRAEVQKAERYLQDLQKYNQDIEHTQGISELLHLAEKPPQKPSGYLVLQDDLYVQAKVSIENKVLLLVETLTKRPLGNIEAYDALRRDLGTCQAALERSGREDLKQECIAALARIQSEYTLLKTEQKEEAILAQVDALHIDDLGLASCRDSAEHFRDLLTNELANSSEAVRQLVSGSLQQLEMRVTDYTQWVASLPQRCSEAHSLKDVRKLRDEIVVKAQHYAKTLELEVVQEWKQKVVEAQRASEEAETREAARKATVSAFIGQMKDHATRISNARVFKDAISEYCKLINPAPLAEGTELNEAEKGAVKALTKNAWDQVSSLFIKFQEQGPLHSASEHERRQAEIKEILGLVSRTTALPAEWAVELERLLNKVKHEYKQWQAEQERLQEEQRRAGQEEQRQRRNLEVIEEVLRQTKSARTLAEIQNAVALIESVPHRLEPPCDQQLAKLGAEHKRLSGHETTIRTWANDTLPRALSTCWDSKAIYELRKAIVDHESLCSCDAEISGVLADSRVRLDQRTNLLSQLVRIEQQCVSLPKCDELLARLTELRGEYPDGVHQISDTERKVRAKVEFLFKEERRKVEQWLSQFHVASATTISPTQASELLRALETPPAGLNSEEEVLMESVRKTLTLRRDADLALRIADDFSKLQTPEQRGECLLKIAQICKREGLLSEYVQRLRELLGLE